MLAIVAVSAAQGQEGGGSKGLGVPATIVEVPTAGTVVYFLNNSVVQEIRFGFSNFAAWKGCKVGIIKEFFVGRLSCPEEGFDGVLIPIIETSNRGERRYVLVFPDENGKEVIREDLVKVFAYLGIKP